MLRFFCLLCMLLSLSLLTISESQATSTQYGATGMISQPTAQTLNEGNICVGLWADCSDGVDNGSGLSSNSSTILPATITMGLGTFIEVYGSYPNLLFNGDEGSSDRGSANVGFKFRVYGKRSDNFRLAVDVQGRRSISDDPDFDGLNDYVSRFIATIKKDSFAIHANAGYAVNDSPDNIDYDDQILLGGGVEYSLATRLRLIGEVSFESEKISGLGEPGEITAGLQYYVTPHLTMNLAGSVGLSDASPDWRILLGMTTCQGVGTYNRPVPKMIEPDNVAEEPLEPIRVSKIRILTPLIAGGRAVADSPIRHLEVAVKNPNEIIIIDPLDRLQGAGGSSLEVSPIGPMGSLTPAGGGGLPDQPFPAKVRRRFRFPELTYAFNQWTLSEEGRQSISLVAEELRKEKKYFIISIEGHTDDVGSDSYNQTLSFKRAVSAATHIVLRDGFDPARIFVKGYGESLPIDDNSTEAGRARNRRVELLILVPEGYDEIEAPGNDVDGSVLGDAESLSQKNSTIDPIVIEQAIMEKTGAETAKPAGAFSQVNKVE